MTIDSSEVKKCCVSRTYAVCAGWPQIFGKMPLLLKKKFGAFERKSPQGFSNYYPVFLYCI